MDNFCIFSRQISFFMSSFFLSWYKYNLIILFSFLIRISKIISFVSDVSKIINGKIELKEEYISWFILKEKIIIELSNENERR